MIQPIYNQIIKLILYRSKICKKTKKQINFIKKNFKHLKKNTLEDRLYHQTLEILKIILASLKKFKLDA